MILLVAVLFWHEKPSQMGARGLVRLPLDKEGTVAPRSDCAFMLRQPECYSSDKRKKDAAVAILDSTPVTYLRLTDDDRVFCDCSVVGGVLLFPMGLCPDGDCPTATELGPGECGL